MKGQFEGILVGLSTSVARLTCYVWEEGTFRKCGFVSLFTAAMAATSEQRHTVLLGLIVVDGAVPSPALTSHTYAEATQTLTWEL